MVAFGECGFAAEIPAFAGMEGRAMAMRYQRKSSAKSSNAAISLSDIQ